MNSLQDVEGLSNPEPIVQDNFEQLDADLYGLRAVNNGATTTIIGPPTSGAHTAGQQWTDVKLAKWLCTVSGTPGTWIQLTPAIVTSDPSSGTIPNDYCILRSDLNYLEKFHRGSYIWRELVGSRNITLVDTINLVLSTTSGTKIGTGTSQLLGFWNATPIVQPAHADQGAVTLG